MLKPLVVLLVFLSSTLNAAPLSTEKERDIKKLLSIMDLPSFLNEIAAPTQQFLMLYMQNAKPGTISPQDAKAVASEVTSVIQALMLEPDGLIDRMVPLYDKYYSHEDILGLISFYESPLGKKLQASSPMLAKEGARLGVTWGLSQSTEIKRRVTLKLAEKGITLPPLHNSNPDCQPGKADPVFYAAKDVNTPPRMRSPISIGYPDLARRQKIEGTVETSIKLDETGQIIDARIIESSHPDIFDAHVLSTLKKSRFSPACKNGFAVRSEIQQKIQFKLN